MNRYLWLALGLLLLLAASLAAILLLDVSNTRVENGISLALKAIATCATVGSAVFGILGRSKKEKAETATHQVIIPPANTSPVRILHADRDQKSSFSTYYRNMRDLILELSKDQRSFVPMTTISDVASVQAIGSGILPKLEWMSRRANPQYVSAEPEEIELFKIPDFRQAVLLGEPGSGKSTLLQRLALQELEHAATWMKNQDAELTESENTGLRLPLYASLSNWQLGVNAEDFLRSQLERLAGGPENYYVSNFRRLLADGHFLLLLDGLNELPGRKVSPSEGLHEQSIEPGNSLRLPTRGATALDQREIELRELASGNQSSFVLTCRSHEYFDSYRWQVVRVLPMDPDQIDRFIEVYVMDADRAADLRRALGEDEKLATIADNPFFLRSITSIYQPGMKLNNRGHILSALYSELLRRERKRLNNILPSDSLFDDSEVARPIGKLGFRMLAAGKVGNQAPLGELDENEGKAAGILTGTGLIVERGGVYFFLHQIIQEFFAAFALNERVVKRSHKTLLADKRWSEVVALWCDLDEDRMPEKIRSALRSRNMPWRRPRSRPTALLAVYQTLTTLTVMVVAASYFWDWVLWPTPILGFPFGLPRLSPIILLAILLAIRVLWSLLIVHRKITINSAYVLSIIRYPAALSDIISALSLLYQRERAEVAQYIGRSFGLMALPHATKRVESRKWRIRAGCVQVLGEIARAVPKDRRALETLLAVARAGDPQLMMALMEALGGCRDDRIPQAVGEMLTAKTNGPTLSYRLSPLTKWDARSSVVWPDEAVANFEDLTSPDRSPWLRSAAYQVIGVLRMPGCETKLTAVARDNSDAPVARQGAITGLGLAQTPLAVERLVELGEEWPDKIRTWVCNALLRVTDPAATPSLVRAARSSRWEIRQAAATPLGATRTPVALDALAKLSADDDYDVREAATRGLSLVDDPAAVPLLGQLARDRNGKVRKAALEALNSRYPDLAGAQMLSLAQDVDYPDRVRIIRSLGGYVQPEIEDGLRQLTGDLDRDVRDSAQAALRRIRTIAGPAKHKRSHGAGMLTLAWHRVMDRLQIACLSELLREERLAGTPENQIWFKVQARIFADAELTRRYKLLFSLFYMAMGILTIIVVLLIILAFHLSLWAVGNLLDIWPYIIGLLVLSAASMLPSVRRLRKVRVLGAIVFLLRFAAGAVILVGILAAVYFVWWILLLIALACTVGGYLVISRKRSRNSVRVHAALETAQ